MRTIIAGCRDFNNYDVLINAIDLSCFSITTVLCGGCSGVDMLGKKWAEKNNITVEMYNAEWNKHGNRAGPIRNSLMAENADALIALWDGSSRGTKNMIGLAYDKNLWVYVHRI